jgi:glycosyltransferase involved in cell wall biosynthesis
MNQTNAGALRDPAITVITPAYNVGRYIGEAVDSVLNQTFSNFEYLVVDDGSTDETVAEIERRAKVDSRVRLIEGNHEGAARARNIGISQARGQYIAFLDGDDRWQFDFLEKQLELLESLPDDVAAVFCRSRVMSDSGKVYLVRWQRKGRYDLDQMLVQSNPARVGSSLLIKKIAFEQAGDFDVELTSAQDLEMWLRIQRDSDMPYFHGSASYLLDIRVRAGAISRDHGRRFSVLDRLITEYAKSMKRTPIGMAFVRAAVFAYRVGDYETADAWASKALPAGKLKLIRDGYGRRMLSWYYLPARLRLAVKRSSNAGRSLVARLVGAADNLTR